MRKNLIRIGTAVAGLAAGAAGFAACGVDSAPSLTINSFHNLKAEQDGCTHDEKIAAGGVFFARGAAQSGTPFQVYVLLENSMPPNGDEDEGRLDTNWVQLTQMEITYDNRGPWSFLPRSRKVPMGIKIPGGGSTLHKSVSAIDAEIARLMIEGADGVATPIPASGDCEELLLTVRGKGRMGDGSEIETNSIDFVVNVCNFGAGCPVGMVAKGGCSDVQPDGMVCEKAPSDDGNDGNGGSGGTGGDGGSGGTGGFGGSGGDGGTGGTGGDGGSGGAGGAGGEGGAGGAGGDTI